MLRIIHWHRHVTNGRLAFALLSLMSFFFSAEVALTMYMDSSFLAETLRHSGASGNPDDMVGIIYTFASLATMLGLLFAPRILRRIGNFRATLTVVFLLIGALLGLASAPGATIIVPLYVLAAGLTSTMYFLFDIFLERYTHAEDLGIVRGAFLAISSTAWILPPILAGRVVEHYGFPRLYLLGALLLLPLLYILTRYFSDFHDPQYSDVNFQSVRRELGADRDLGRGLIANFFLQGYYAAMVIYTPLFLVAGHFSLIEYGTAMAVALSAFVLFPYPAGILADRRWGEKEMLIIGFLIMAAGAALVPMVVARGSFLLLAGLLFFTRFGASVVETMAETYYFKKITEGSAGLVQMYRQMRPLAWLSIPLIASLVLEFRIVDLRGIFFVIGGAMILPLFSLARLHDTR